MARVKLGDVAREYKATCGDQKEGLRVVGLEHLVPQQIILTLWDEGKENTFTKMFKKGQVLFGRRRAYLKKAAVAPFDGICSGDITVIEAIPGKILPELLPFIIQNDTLFDFAVERSAGSLSPRVKWEHLKNFEFELPELDKQQELADILWASERAKTAYRELISSTNELVKSQFIEMFGDCETVPISTMGIVITGGTPSKKNASYYSSPDIPFYKPNDFSDNSIIELDVSSEFVSEKAREVADIFPQGSVLVTCIGTIGKIGILTKEATCNQQINVIIPNQSKCYSEFIAYAIWCNRQRLMSIANATTVTIINKSNFENFEIPCPSIELQKAFVALCQQFDKSKFVLQETLKYDKISYFSMIKSA